MYNNREEKSIKKCFYVRKKLSIRLQEEPSAREVESDDNGTNHVDKERKNRAKYPGSKHSGTPESFIDGYVFEIEDIFDESETECNKDREEDSFFDGVDGGKRASEN